MRTCCKCKETKPYSEFYRNKTGYGTKCKKCSIEDATMYQMRKYIPSSEREHFCHTCGVKIDKGYKCETCKAKTKLKLIKPRFCKKCGIEITKGKALCEICREENKKLYYKKKNLTYLEWARLRINSKISQGFDVRITREELAAKAEQTACCPLCGVEFNYLDRKGTTTATAPSLDRIDNEHIVTNDNTWIVCYQCNSTKRNRTLQEFIDYCTTISKYKQQSI